MELPLLDFFKVYCHSFVSEDIRLKFSSDLYTKNAQANALNYKILRWNPATFSHDVAPSNVGYVDLDILMEFVAATRLVRVTAVRDRIRNWDLFDFNSLFLLGEMRSLSAPEIKAFEDQAVINN